MKFAVVVVLLAVALCGEVSSKKKMTTEDPWPTLPGTCDVVTCDVDPCTFTRCAAWHRCVSCNCQAYCDPMTLGLGRR
ncbi:hypothetical protein V1264_011165 [Littorina saxatilis]|uniref:Uncharacterized protein n=1 Tax=Littorina saxatilis TaxID=31220 RepID=A0AAN9BUJ3_9CAEN